jgi:opacity protein-like surface antigen
LNLIENDGFFVTFNINLKGRKMKINTRNFSTIIILSLLAFVLTSAVSSAQEYSRKGQGEFYGILQTLGGGEATASDRWVEFDDTNVYGIGIGGNITDHWNVNMDFLFGSTDLEPGGPAATATSGDTNIWLWDINIDYNILNQRLTPLVTGGIGLLGFSGDFNNGSSFSESNFSYNLGVGGRWDVADNIFVKVVYKKIWTDLEDMDGPDFDGINLNVGLKF